MLDEMLCHQGLALSDGEIGITYAELSGIVEEISSRLRASGARIIGIALDNSPLWAALDLAIMNAGLVCVPLPGFFSSSQLSHVIRDAGVDLIFTDRPAYFTKLPGVSEAFSENVHCGRKYAEIPVGHSKKEMLPAGTAKITYTSGTTGSPKGVCLDHSAILAVARSLVLASKADRHDRYVSVLPLATLLENIGGLYVPLLSGACSHVLPAEKVGIKGAAKFEAEKLVEAFTRHRASCAILTPGMLQTLIGFVRRHRHALPDLRFLAVGGAPVSERLLDESEELGLPVFEGYGLSECASVVSLNTAGGRKHGSVGRPLPHVDLKFAEDGEILVRGAVMLGYCGMAPVERKDFLPTGDTGYLDEAGFLHLTGRKKNIFITSHGRNVSPEWVEKELTAHPAILQAAVFGEGKPWNAAVIVPKEKRFIEEAVRLANGALPDYARIGKWLVAHEPFLPQNGQLTPNGGLRRDAIWPLYRDKIEALYET